MTEEARQARKEYRREWQRKNIDKVRAYNVKYWSRRAAAQETPGEIPDEERARQARKEYHIEWQNKNREKVRAYNEKSRAKRAAAQAAPEEIPTAE